MQLNSEQYTILILALVAIGLTLTGLEIDMSRENSIVRRTIERIRKGKRKEDE